MSVNLLLIFFVLIVVAMIAFILVQKGTGATAGSAFGAGASNTVFGSKGSGNFLTKTTMILAFLFFAISMFMAVQASKQFSTAATGEVDLGVAGKLDTSNSDVPQLTPTEPVEGTESDVPNLKDKVLDKASDIKDGVTQTAVEVKDTVAEKTADIKGVVVEAKDKVIENATDVIKEKAVEVKDKIDG